MKFREPLLGQMVMLRRFADRAKAAVEVEEDENRRSTLMTDLVVKTLDVVESLIEDPADVAFIQALMLEGKLDYDELTKGVLNREGRAKKEPVKAAKKASKTVANRGRTRS